MMGVRDLPALNATLNATAAVLLLFGYAMIRRRRVEAHRRIMTAAFAVSAAFLVSYLVYHSQAGSVRFQKTGMIRPVYFSILISHTLLAATVPVLAPLALYRGWRGKYDLHRRVARWTLPIWLYVSVTGVAVYVMLYKL